MVTKMLVDPHVHTAVGSYDSIISPQQLIIKAKQRRIGALCVTDHNSYDGIKETQEVGAREDVIVIKGIEMDTEYGDVLIYGVDISELPSMKLDKLVDMVHAKSGAVVIPHPFVRCDLRQKTMRSYLVHYLKEISSKISNEAHSIEIGIEQLINFVQDRDPTLMSILKKVDGIEVLNSTCSVLDKWLAFALAEYLGKNKIGSSDAHIPEQVGLYATVFPSDIECERDFIQYLKYGKNLEPIINFTPNKMSLPELTPKWSPKE
jgi:predicted metal-dependent phosphoesterase TrpH